MTAVAKNIWFFFSVSEGNDCDKILAHLRHPPNVFLAGTKRRLIKPDDVVDVVVVVVVVVEVTVVAVVVVDVVVVVVVVEVEIFYCIWNVFSI